MLKENELAKRLVSHYGDRGAAADALSVHKETIRLWLKDGIPLEKAVDVETRSKGIVTAEEILEDVKARTLPRRRGGRSPARANA